MPSRRQSSEMFSSPRSPSSTMRTSLPPSTAGGADAKRSSAPALPVLYPARISVSSSLLAATMNQKSSLPEVPQLVSQVLTGDTQLDELIHQPCDDAFGAAVEFWRDALHQRCDLGDAHRSRLSGPQHRAK